MSELISIVIPVYNVEKYLERCVKSVINQTYKNIEIILVDDGSKDKSGALCDEFAKLDDRIIVIHKENGGLSDARNYGLNIAKGELIGFVDSDDYITEDMFESLYKTIVKNNADISIVSFYEMYNGKLIGMRNSGKLEVFSKIEAMKELLIDTKIQSYAWNKLFRKKLFDDLKFPTGKNFEDIATTLLLFEKCEKIALLEEPKYYYLRRDDSIIGVKNSKTYTDYLEVIFDKYLYLKDKYPEIELYNAYNYIINMIWVYSIIVTFELNEVYKEFEKRYDLFEKLVKKYEKEIIELLDDYNKAILYMMLVNKDISKEAVKQFYIACKEKETMESFRYKFSRKVYMSIDVLIILLRIGEKINEKSWNINIS